MGPVNGYYNLDIGTVDEALIRGGGNVLCIVNSTGDNPYNFAIVSTADPAATASNGSYSIMAGSPIILQREDSPFSQRYLTQNEMYDYLTSYSITLQTPLKYVSIGQTNFEYRVGYVNGSTIGRTTSIPIVNSENPEIGFKKGYLNVATMADATNNPTLYSLP